MQFPLQDYRKRNLVPFLHYHMPNPISFSMKTKKPTCVGWLFWHVTSYQNLRLRALRFRASKADAFSKIFST